jgi:hypothetical protein
MEIFNDFSKKNYDMTVDELHQKRLIMEERIFTILKYKYLNYLKEWWFAYQVPKVSDKSIVIVERRIHPNLEFILYNSAYFARNWAITIVCSDINIDYIRSLLGPNIDSVKLIQMFEGNPAPAVGKNEYNYLLQSSEFYEAMPSENLLMMEMDTYLRKPLPSEILDYDYVAAPYGWDTNSSGGGLSFRKRSAMLAICSNFTDSCHAQDIYALRGMKNLGYLIPPYEIGVEYFCESCLYEDPVGFHQWWTFFSITDQEDDYFFNQYMTLEL